MLSTPRSIQILTQNKWFKTVYILSIFQGWPSLSLLLKIYYLEIIKSWHSATFLFRFIFPRTAKKGGNQKAMALGL